MASFVPPPGLSKKRLDVVVEALKETMSKEDIRRLGQRAVQGKVWHLVPEVSQYMTDLRHQEELVRSQIMGKMSKLVYRFHRYTLDTTLARAGVVEDERLNAGSSLDSEAEFDILCLDAKERLYLIFKQYGWLEEFFRHYPQHFYENSFRFVDLIPAKKLPVKVRVVGMGVGGSLAVSGLAKAGVAVVIGHDARGRSGMGGVCSRYQNASWRAYDVSEQLLDKEAYEHLCQYRQRINVTYDDGSSKVITTDRVQIIIGDAVNSALESAERYGADIRFNEETDQYFDSSEDESAEWGDREFVDIVGLFCGVHTPDIFPGLREEMEVASWPEVSSECKMWLRIKESRHTGAYCSRGGELGAEKWHYTIDSSRTDSGDILRVQDALCSQFKLSQETPEYREKAAQLRRMLEHMETPGHRFDYEFTNAPDNVHNQAKRAALGGPLSSVVLDGGYRVDVKIAGRCIVGGCDTGSRSDNCEELLRRFGTNLVVTGGDACVPPNPLAAYGATLACVAADMLVQLAVAHGHLNAILLGIQGVSLSGEDNEWLGECDELKDLFAEFYNVRSRSENYFQWVQTLICNLYSLPAQYPTQGKCVSTL